MVDTNKLKARIVLADYTQERLAKDAGMGLNSLNAKINGKAIFNCDEVDILCDLLNIVDAEEKVEIFLA